jgi:geranyl diphosphate 2-C-methyltransferase
MQKSNIVMTPYEKRIAAYWNNKTNDAINLELGKKDKLIHHHFGIGNLTKETNLFTQEEMTDELHRLEANQTALAIKLMKGIGSVHIVIDAGSGRGGTAFMLHNILGCNVIGINTSGYQVDFSNQLANELKVDGHVHFNFDNMERMNLDDKSVNAVITNETTMYIKNLEKLFIEFKRVLCKGGIYVLATWCKNDLFKGTFTSSQKIEDHYILRMHYHKEYIQALINVGFIPYTIWDLTEEAIPYWKLRSCYSYKTGIEDAFLDAYNNGEMAYMMIGAYLS